MKKYFVYILRCDDGKYYTGVTSDIDRRMIEHNEGRYPSCFTYNRRPLELVFMEEFSDPDQAILIEKKIQKWSRKKKEALIAANFEALTKLCLKKNFARQRCSEVAACWSCLATPPPKQKRSCNEHVSKGTS